MLRIDIHLPEARSLKAKRALVKPIVEGARRRFSVSAAEVDHQDVWQRASLGMAAVSASAGHAEEVLDAVERFVWAQPDIEVLGADRRWLDLEG